MRNKMINHGIAIIGIAILFFLSIACASTPDDYEEISPDRLSTYEHFSYAGRSFVTETRLKPVSRGSGLEIDLVDARGTHSASIKNLNDSLLEERIEAGKMYRVYLTNTGDAGVLYITRIDGLMSIEEAQARIEQKDAERIATEAKAKAEREAAEEARVAQAKARQEQQEQIKRAEQERLANLYRQAGNNLGNLKNTSRRYGTVFGRDYLTTIYDFGDGNYIVQTESVLGWGLFRPSPKTGTYRVNGDTVIFLSSEGNYFYGTIVGTALNIGGDIYR